MTDERAEAREELRREAEGLTGGPGVVASKSQAKGSVVGIIAGAVVGAVLGLLVALVAYSGSGRAIVIAVISFAVAGSTFGGVVGGFLKPRRKLEHTDTDA